MHVQFPPLDRTFRHPAAEGGSTVVPPMLSPATGLRGGNASCREHGTGEAASEDVVFPLENLLLENAVCDQEVKSAVPGTRSNVEYEEVEEGTHNPPSGSLSAINPQQTLLHKQAIVESLQRAVQDFSKERDVVLLNYINGLAGKLDL